MSNPEIKVIFLDIDNTLLSFTGYVRQAMREGFELFHLRPYDDSMYPVFERVNTSVWRRLEQGTLSYQELLKIRWKQIFEELGIDGDGPAFEEYFRGQLFSSAILEPNAMELLEYLHGKYVLCVASNGPYAQQMNRLRLAGMDPYFDYFFVSEKIGASKPGKAFFDYCFNQLHQERFPHLSPEEAMIIGDSLTSDIAGGRAYGMRTCFYCPGEGAEADHLESDYVVKSLLDIKAFLYNA